MQLCNVSVMVYEQRVQYIDETRHTTSLLYSQGIIQTKMEVGIRFWAPNLGLSPKYD